GPAPPGGGGPAARPGLPPRCASSEPGVQGRQRKIAWMDPTTDSPEDAAVAAGGAPGRRRDPGRPRARPVTALGCRPGYRGLPWTLVIQLRAAARWSGPAPTSARAGLYTGVSF